MDPTPETALYPKNTARDVEPEPAVSVFFLSFFLNLWLLNRPLKPITRYMFIL